MFVSTMPYFFRFCNYILYICMFGYIFVLFIFFLLCLLFQFILIFLETEENSPKRNFLFLGRFLNVMFFLCIFISKFSFLYSAFICREKSIVNVSANNDICNVSGWNFDCGTVKCCKIWFLGVVVQKLLQNI